MTLPRPRRIAAGAALLSALTLGACGGEDGSAPGDPSDPVTTDSSAATEPGSTSGQDLSRGADVADFCAAMSEIDAAIDASDPSDSSGSADWQRVVASFDALREVGIPDDFPAEADEQVRQIEALVRQSDSLAEFDEAVREAATAGDLESQAVDDYLDDACA